MLTEKVEEKLDLHVIRSKFSEKTIASQTQRRMLLSTALSKKLGINGKI